VIGQSAAADRAEAPPAGAADADRRAEGGSDKAGPAPARRRAWGGGLLRHELMQRFSLQLNVVAAWIAHAVTLGVGFLMMPYVVRVMGDGAYGAWVFVGSIASYSALLYLGFGETISRFAARAHAARDWRSLNAVCSLTFAVYSGMALVALGLGLVLVFFVPGWTVAAAVSTRELQWVVVLLALQVAISMPGSVFGGILMGAQRFDLERGVLLVSDLVRLAAIYLLLTRENGLAILAGIYLAVTVAETIAHYALARGVAPGLSLSPRNITSQVVREAFHFSGFAFLNSLALQLVYMSDTIVIGCFLGAEAIVPYYIAARLVQFLRQPVSQLALVCLPAAGALEHDGERLRRLAMRSFAVAFLLTAGQWIGAAWFGGRLIQEWMGPGYGEAHRILLILLGAQVVVLPLSVLRAILVGTGAARVPALIYFGEALFNLALSIVLCRWWGAVGVAWGTTVPAVVIETGLLLPYAMQRLKIAPRALFSSTAVSCAIPLGLLAAWAAWLSVLTPGRTDWLLLILAATGGVSLLGAAWLASERIVQAFRAAASSLAARRRLTAG